MTKKNTGKQAALVAALTLLGTSLGIGTQVNAAGTNTTTSTDHKGEAAGIFIKRTDTTSTQYKEHTTSTQHKDRAPSAMFLKIDGLDKSKQQKTDTSSKQLKLDTPGGAH